MSRWISERIRDAYYREARRRGYRSRAVFKLMEMDEKFGIFREGQAVLDLGAAPGSWSQYARERVGEGGLVVAVDRSRMEPIKGVVFLRIDVFDDEVFDAVQGALGNRIGFDVVLSDMAPNVSGHPSLDHARSLEILERVLQISERFLLPGGVMVCKVFQGDMLEDWRRRLRGSFRFVRLTKPAASPRSSSELYFVAKGFKPSAFRRGPRA
ncbi:MAG: RlmE family RNA methyltransferase [Thermoplasmata archaeon]|nr:RlmE family RNA methyltransferase [Thermoplasmata archaeon]